MSKNSNNYLANTITDYYFDLPYNEHYDSDILFTIIVTSIVFLICLFLYIKSKIESYRSKWYKYKCHPILMPFAATVNPQGSKSADMDYTYDNFKGCLDQFLEELLYHVKQPIKGTVDQFVLLIKTIFKHLRTIIQMIVSAIVSVFGLLRGMLDRLGLFVNEIGILSGYILAFFGKILSIITNIFYSLITLIKMLKLFFTLFAVALYMVTILPTRITLAVSTTIFSACCVAAYFFPWFTIPFIFVGIPSLVISIGAGVLLYIFEFIHSVVDEFAEDVAEASAKTQVPTNEGGSSLTPKQYYSQKMENITVEQLDSLSPEKYTQKVEAFTTEVAQIFISKNISKKPDDMPLLVWYKIKAKMEELRS